MLWNSEAIPQISRWARWQDGLAFTFWCQWIPLAGGNTMILDTLDQMSNPYNCVLCITLVEFSIACGYL